MDEDDQNNPDLIFQTHFYLNDAFYGNHCKKSFEIFPNSPDKKWNFTILSCFLNELTNFEPYARNPFTTSISGTSITYSFSFIDNITPIQLLKSAEDNANSEQSTDQGNENGSTETEEAVKNNDADNKDDEIRSIDFHVEINTFIKVTCSLQFIKTFFVEQKSFFPSLLRKWGKLRTAPKPQWHSCFILKFNRITSGTYALLHHKPIIFCSILDFSNIFIYFCKKSQKVLLPLIYDTFTINEFISFFLPKKIESVRNLEQVKNKTIGYLFLELQKSKTKKRLTKYPPNEENSYIFGGIYISPYAKSLFESYSHLINGLLLDTTFKVLPNYVTSILMISIKNTGIPVSFAFGNSENKALYNKHFEIFQIKLGIDISKYYFESDQGTALLSIFDDYGVRHCACLRHLLVSLKFNKVSFAISTILKCGSLFDLNNALLFYSDIFSNFTDPEDVKLRDNLLPKVGLSYENGLILINDDKRWREVSMLERADIKMPSTTNSLEAFHGQLNNQIPRRNSFWNAFYRLCKNFMRKNNSINDLIHHNYVYEKKQTVGKGLRNFERIESEVKFYQTTEKHCLCGQNKLISSILDVDFPCIHRFYNGENFPECPRIDLRQLKMNFDELIIETTDVADDLSNAINSDSASIDKFYIIQMVRRYSHFKNREEIEKWVSGIYEEMKVDEDVFINNKPGLIYRIINQGINHFNEISKKVTTKKQNKQ